MNRLLNSRILIVDDDEDDYFIISDAISQIPTGSFTVEWAYQYTDALEKMQGNTHDLYFLDYRLGARSGMDLLREAIESGCEAPIVLLTGGGSRRTEFDAIQSGAADYLVKSDVNVERIERCIRYALERMHFLKVLRANERRFRSLFERSKDPVFVLDAGLYFLDANEACAQLLGFPKEELLKKPFTDFIDGGTPEREIHIQTLREEIEIQDLEIELVNATGEKRQVLLGGQRQESTDSGFLQGIMHDITNLRRTEKATLRTEKLAATGRLVRTLAHEVRNPLNNITLSVEQIQAENPDESIEMYLDIIQRNSKRISDLITELLNSSRPTEIVMTETPFQHVLDTVMSRAIDRLTLKNINFSLDYPTHPVLVLADAEKLSIALLNIIINASEALDGIADSKLLLSLREEDGQAIVTIEDNGCGIPEDNLTRLFEPYFTQKRNGMGLGLASTLNIVKAHGGVIEVNSEVGKGTTFTVTLPLAVPAETTADSANVANS